MQNITISLHLSRLGENKQDNETKMISNILSRANSRQIAIIHINTFRNKCSITQQNHRSRRYTALVLSLGSSEYVLYKTHGNELARDLRYERKVVRGCGQNG